MIVVGWKVCGCLLVGKPFDVDVDVDVDDDGYCGCLCS